MPTHISENPWWWLLGLLITSGFGKYLIDIYREHKARQAAAPPPTPARQAEIDQSLLVMTKSAQLLTDDNARLRATAAEEDERRRRERADWEAERLTYQREIRELREEVRRLNEQIVKVSVHSAEIGARLDAIQQKHNTDEIPAIGGGESRRSNKTYEIRED